MTDGYRHTGKQVLFGSIHIADAHTEEIAAMIVDGLNRMRTPMPSDRSDARRRWRSRPPALRDNGR